MAVSKPCSSSGVGWGGGVPLGQRISRRRSDLSHHPAPPPDRYQGQASHITEVSELGDHHSDLAGDGRSSKPAVFLKQGNHISNSLGVGFDGLELVAELDEIALSLALSSASRSFSLSI